MFEVAYHSSPVGNLKIESKNGQLWSVSMVKEVNLVKNNNPLLAETIRQFDEYFAGKRKSFDLPLAWRGTSFQIEVWQNLLKIPYGQTWSYQDVARRIGQVRAGRAVGNANKANPLMIIVPCHRVIRANGEIGGYGSGELIKKYLLDLEKQSSGYCKQ